MAVAVEVVDSKRPRYGPGDKFDEIEDSYSDTAEKVLLGLEGACAITAIFFPPAAFVGAALAFASIFVKQKDTRTEQAFTYLVEQIEGKFEKFEKIMQGNFAELGEKIVEIDFNNAVAKKTADLWGRFESAFKSKMESAVDKKLFLQLCQDTSPIDLLHVIRDRLRRPDGDLNFLRLKLSKGEYKKEEFKRWKKYVADHVFQLLMVHIHYLVTAYDDFEAIGSEMDRFCRIMYEIEDLVNKIDDDIRIAKKKDIKKIIEAEVNKGTAVDRLPNVLKDEMPLYEYIVMKWSRHDGNLKLSVNADFINTFLVDINDQRYLIHRFTDEFAENKNERKTNIEDKLDKAMKEIGEELYWNLASKEVEEIVDIYEPTRHQLAVVVAHPDYEMPFHLATTEKAALRLKKFRNSTLEGSGIYFNMRYQYFVTF